MAVYKINESNSEYGEDLIVAESQMDAYLGSGEVSSKIITSPSGEYLSAPAVPIDDYNIPTSGTSVVEAGEQDEMNRKIDTEYYDLLEAFSNRTLIEIDYTSAIERIINTVKEFLETNKVEDARKKINEALELYPDSKRLQKLYYVIKPPKAKSVKMPARKKIVKEIDWLKMNSKNYKGEWVALYDDILLSHNADISIVLDEAKQKYALKDVLIHYVPE